MNGQEYQEILRMKKRAGEKGGIIIYILIAIVFTALLIATLTGGPRRNMQTAQFDQLSAQAAADIATIENAINDCILNYSMAIDKDGDGDMDATDNPNPPFPLYNSTGVSDSGGAGTALENIVCTGAPGMPPVFNNQPGKTLRLFDDTATWTVTYTTSTTEGVMLRVARASADPLWSAAQTRLNAKYSTCKAAAAVSGGACAAGCFYYWILRRATSVTATESGACP